MLHAKLGSMRGHRPGAGSRRVATSALAVVVAIGVAACGSSGSSTSSNSGSSASASTSGSGGGGSSSLSGKTVALVSVANSNPWAAVFNRIVKERLTAAGASVKVTGSAEPPGQVQLLNEAVAEHPDLIMLEALDSKAVAPSIAKAKSEGITVVNADGRADPSVASGLHQVLSNNVALGEYAAENIVEGLEAEGKKRGKIGVITGTASMLLTQERMKGFDKVLGEHPGYTVAWEQDGNWEPGKAGELATQMFAKFGKTGLQAAYGMADYMAVPILTAAKQAGVPLGLKEKGLIVTGGNCFKIGIEAIEAGEMYGTATEDPGTIANQISTYSIKLLAGEEVPLTEMVQEGRVYSKTLSKYKAQCSKA